MKIFTCLFLLLLSPALFAQQPVKRIVNSCGSSYTTGNTKLKVSVGEPMVGTHPNTSATLSQGFFQSKPAPVLVPAPVTGYRFYPNPTKDELQIKGDITKVKQLQLHDAAGRMVMNTTVTTGNIPVKALQAGLYTARLIGDNGAVIYIMKLVKL